VDKNVSAANKPHASFASVTYWCNLS